MSSPRIDAVISDFGGVLTNPLFEAFSAWQDHIGVSSADLAGAMQRVSERLGEHPLFELEKGLITEEEFGRRLESELGGPKLTGFRDLYFEHLHPNEPMIDYLRGLKDRGFRMGLLTNNVREWEPLWRPMLPIDEIFEAVVDSAFVGLRKPDPAIYELMLERLDGIAAENCVFIDDLDVNCQTARELGMHPVLFTHADEVIPQVEKLVAK